MPEVQVGVVGRSSEPEGVEGLGARVLLDASSFPYRFQS